MGDYSKAAAYATLVEREDVEAFLGVDLEDGELEASGWYNGLVVSTGALVNTY